MENAWIRLEAWFGDKSLFIKDLMQDIKGVAPIKEGDDERLMDYYVTLQAHIEEAGSAGALDMLLIPAHHLGEESLERSAGQIACRGQALVHGCVRQRETAVCHQHGSHKRETCTSQGDSIPQVPEITIFGGSRRTIQSPRIVREEREGHGCDREQERRPEEGALPATEELGSRGQVDSGLCDVQGVRREARAREV